MCLVHAGRRVWLIRATPVGFSLSTAPSPAVNQHPVPQANDAGCKMSGASSLNPGDG